MNSKATFQSVVGVKDLSRIRHFVEEFAGQNHIVSEAKDDILLALTELVTNSLLHGYQSKSGLIKIEIQLEGSTLLVRVCDQAPPYDPTQALDPDLSLPLEKRSLGGLGIYLARKSVDHILYQYNSLNENEILMIKEGVV